MSVSTVRGLPLFKWSQEKNKQKRTLGDDKEKRRLDAKRYNAALALARRRGRHSQEQWVSLLEFCGTKCLSCGAQPKPGGWIGGVIHKDHIVAPNLGGSDAIDNIQPLCYRCNGAKRNENTTDLRPLGWRVAVFGARK